MSLSLLTPDFFPQCRDAVQYLQLGELCATTGQCYHELRPVGAQLWFSLPYRLGLPPESLLWLHGLLWLLSVSLSGLALAEWVHRALRVTHRVRWLAVMLMVPSAIVHAVYFAPVMWVSLTDAPAGLSLLIGIWLLLLSFRFPYKSLLLAAALVLGLAYSLRLAYFYPVVLAVSVHLFFWVLQRGRRSRELLLLIALVPALLQSTVTYREHDNFSMIDPEVSGFWRSFHLGSEALGYDTLWPGLPYRWGTCLMGYGFDEAWESKSLGSLYCLFAGRLRFYMGSYAAQTYLFYGRGNLLEPWQMSVSELSKKWPVDGAEWQATDMPSPYMDQVMGALVPVDGYDRFRLYRDVSLESGKYAFSLWLWSPSIREARLQFVRINDGKIAGEKTVKVPDYPDIRQVWSVVDDGRYRLVLDWSAHDSLVASSPLYVWGGKLERGMQATPYGATQDISRARWWSGPLQAWSSLMFVLSVLLLVVLRKHWHRGALAAVTLVGAVFAEAMVIVPEQRFGVVFMTVFWLCPFALLLFWFERWWFRRKTISRA